jgi:hypothetical protein
MELPIVVWMEGVDDAECSRHTVCTGCNRRRRQTRSWSGSWEPYAASCWTT